MVTPACPRSALYKGTQAAKPQPGGLLRKCQFRRELVDVGVGRAPGVGAVGGVGVQVIAL
jgi:hypothetical protein